MAERIEIAMPRERRRNFSVEQKLLIVEETRARYVAMYERITGLKWD